MRIVIGLAVLLAATCTLRTQVHAQQSASIWDGVYTPDQAGRGKSAYSSNCASCHGEALDGSEQTPALSGDDFKGNWDGRTLDDLFEAIQSTMPANKPGQLSREQNASILAYILSFDGFPAGTKELPTDAAALQKVRFDATQPK